MRFCLTIHLETYYQQLKTRIGKDVLIVLLSWKIMQCWYHGQPCIIDLTTRKAHLLLSLLWNVPIFPSKIGFFIFHQNTLLINQDMIFYFKSSTSLVSCLVSLSIRVVNYQHWAKSIYLKIHNIFQTCVSVFVAVMERCTKLRK